MDPLYILLAGIIIIALVFLIIFKIEDYKEKQHPKHS